jgi:hypothetical protein
MAANISMFCSAIPGKAEPPDWPRLFQAQRRGCTLDHHAKDMSFDGGDQHKETVHKAMRFIR